LPVISINGPETNQNQKLIINQDGTVIKKAEK
jgi:hypothetical protein